MMQQEFNHHVIYESCDAPRRFGTYACLHVTSSRPDAADKQDQTPTRRHQIHSWPRPRHMLQPEDLSLSVANFSDSGTSGRGKKRFQLFCRITQSLCGVQEM